MTYDDYHHKIMECIVADDLQAALDYIEAAEKCGYDMSFEREQLDLAAIQADADYQADEMHERISLSGHNGELV